MLRLVSAGANERGQDGGASVTREIRFREGLSHEKRIDEAGLRPPDCPRYKASGDITKLIPNNL